LSAGRQIKVTSKKRRHIRLATFNASAARYQVVKSEQVSRVHVDCRMGTALTLGIEIIGQWARQAAGETFGNDFDRSAESPVND
jgi:hypothetical protein